jgi:hypothetical protein
MTTTQYKTAAETIIAHARHQMQIARVMPRCVPLCLPCFRFRNPKDFEPLKAAIDQLLPAGWTTEWTSRNGKLVPGVLSLCRPE